MIYKVDGISGDIVVKLPHMMVRIGILSYNLMRSSDQDAVASYHDSSKDPDDHWKGYSTLELGPDLTLVKQATIDKWDIKIHEEIYQDLIELCFRDED